jgi:hypothetical protein
VITEITGKMQSGVGASEVAAQVVEKRCRYSADINEHIKERIAVLCRFLACMRAAQR